MTRGFLGLGSNLGDKRAHLEAALAALRARPDIEVRRVARFYRTAALGPVKQDWFLNTVAEIATGLAPRALLARCQEIERQLGRERHERWGPRTIDLDVLWLETGEVDEPGLTVPHPGLHLRSFALAPLHDLAPGLQLRGHSVEHWLRQAEPLELAEVP
ncbi:MAG TPA: 2-amino-4-hydroxy-6-hydroxymethyldihydropteridine diphosphokinase [Opitutaceae bacterium]|nr:2-amino-4-hydroxy-6-hydroxymethyldihydropteridine diphosphokinase [Opitutaceae bacterium]